MVEFWISKTRVRIEPSEMTRDEAVILARDLIKELIAPPPPLPMKKHTRWSEEMDNELRSLRNDGHSIREIARLILGDVGRVGSISGRVRRLSLTVDELARKRGLASAAHRRINNA